jgi:dihydropteroate synthase
MGVINLSPDSKNVHTVAHSVDEALLMADRYRSWGATLVDVGGQSSHLDNPTIDSADEISLVVPAIEALVAEGHLVSIDTWKPDVAAAAVEAGAVIVNDTGGMAGDEMREVVAGSGVAAVAVYVEGENPHDVGEIEIRDDKAEVTAERLARLIDELAEAGIDNVILDPGIALNYRGDYAAYTRMQLQVIAGQAGPGPDPPQARLRSGGGIHHARSRARGRHHPGARRCRRLRHREVVRTGGMSVGVAYYGLIRCRFF